MHRVVALCRRIAGTRRFLALTFSVILANALVIGIQTYEKAEESWGVVLDKLNAIFLAFFVVELTIRITAYGRRPWRFFRDGWNVFDFAMTVPVLIPGVRESTTALRVVRCCGSSGSSAPSPRCGCWCPASGAVSRRC